MSPARKDQVHKEPQRRGEALRLFSLVNDVHRRGGTVLLLGIGNELLGEDAVGALIARDLAAVEVERFESVAVGIAIENASHLPVRRQADLVVLVDAAVTHSRRPRSWRLLPTHRLDTFCHSTHSIPLALLVRYWQQERPGLEACFVGVTVNTMELGAELGRRVSRARKEIVAVVAAALQPAASSPAG